MVNINAFLKLGRETGILQNAKLWSIHYNDMPGMYYIWRHMGKADRLEIKDSWREFRKEDPITRRVKTAWELDAWYKDAYRRMFVCCDYCNEPLQRGSNKCHNCGMNYV